MRHREFGDDCPMVDIDFLAVEYDRATPMALIEYKHEFAAPVRLRPFRDMSPSVKALVVLANRAQVPAFVVRYKDDFAKYKVSALNRRAADFIEADPLYDGAHVAVMTEVGYVEFLYRLRGRDLPDSVRAKVENLPHEPSGSI